MEAQINATPPNVIYATHIKDLDSCLAQFTPDYGTQTLRLHAARPITASEGVIDAIIADLT